MSATKTPETDRFHREILASNDSQDDDLVRYRDFANRLERERDESRKSERLVRMQLAAERAANRTFLRSVYLRAEVGVPLVLLPAEVDEIRRILSQEGAA